MRRNQEGLFLWSSPFRSIIEHVDHEPYKNTLKTYHVLVRLFLLQVPFEDDFAKTQQSSAKQRSG